MAYLVRKLLKRNNIDLIGLADCVETMVADAATGEFRTKKGTISTWKIDSIDSIEEAVLAIIVTADKIERMDFIIIDTHYLDEEDLQYSQTYAGCDIAVPDLQNTHYDVSGITIPKLINFSKVYKRVYIEDNDRNLLIQR